VNFSPRRLVENIVNAEVKNGQTGKTPGACASGKPRPAWFAFGARRSQIKGPRRLFVPQKRVGSTVFETKAQRPHAILRMISTTA
jgi:hypothetical protein